MNFFAFFFFSFQKPACINERTYSLWYMTTQLRVDISNKDWFLLFLTQKMATFPQLSGTLVLSRFSCFVRFGRFKTCSGLRIFYAFDRKPAWRYVSIHLHEPQFLGLTFLDLLQDFFLLFPIPVKCMPSKKEKMVAEDMQECPSKLIWSHTRRKALKNGTASAKHAGYDD